MKNLLEIAQKLLTIDTRYFQEESIKDVDLNSFDIVDTLYKKDGVLIIIATDMIYDAEFDETNECDYLFTDGLTKEEKRIIENTAQMIYRNKMWER